MSLARLEDEFVKCRSWGHEWDTFAPLRRRASWGTLMSLRCSRCSMERHDTIDANGDVSTRQYKPPPGYKLVGVDGRPKGAELRLEVIRRIRRQSRKNRRAA